MLNLSLFLAAIATVESGNNDFAIGPRGEVSRYQIMPAIWKQKAPILALERPNRGKRPNPQLRTDAARAAILIIRDIQHTFASHHIFDPTPSQTAAAWNYGPDRFIRLKKGHIHSCPADVRDYAQRVANIYTLLLENQQPHQPERGVHPASPAANPTP